MRLLFSIVGAVGVLGLAGCKDLTSVDAPDVIQPGDYTTAAGAATLAAGAITQFHRVFGGGGTGTGIGSSVIRQSGLMTDELMQTGPAEFGESDDGRIAPDPSSPVSAYIPLQSARQRLLQAIGAFQQAAPDSTARIGQLFALLGYTSVFLGETYCAGVPLSRTDADLRPVYGPPLTTAQLFEAAIQDFDSALVYGADSARVADLARVGQGRALLNLGRFSEAAAAVASVPTEYVYQVTYLAENEAVQNSFAFSSVTGVITKDLTVPEQEGTNGLNWRTAGDSRVPLLNRSPGVVGNDGVTEVWGYLPYEAPDAPIPLAGGTEARLTEAEVALQAGDAGTWLTTHNTLRATVGLGPLADPGSADTRVDLHFRERAFWLFLTGHRHGDLRRLVRQYGRGAETVFPTAHWRDGIQYGMATNFAPPAEQRSNPNYSGCLNRDA